MPPIRAVSQQPTAQAVTTPQQQQQQRDTFERDRTHKVIKTSETVGTSLFLCAAFLASGGTAAAFALGAPVFASVVCVVILVVFLVCAFVLRPKTYRVHPHHIARSESDAEQIIQRERAIRAYAIHMHDIAHDLSSRTNPSVFASEQAIRATPPPPYSAT